MVWTRLPISVMILSAFSCASASAGPMLLGSFEDYRAVVSPPGVAPEVQIVLQIGDVPRPVGPATSLGADIWWGEGARGYVDFTGKGSPSFSVIAARAKDGILDQFAALTVFDDGTAHGTIESETYLYGRDADLAGFELDLIRLIVESVQFEQQTFDELQYYIVKTRVKYEFYGVPIPEPSSVVVLGLLSGGYLWPRRKLQLHSRGVVS